MGNSVVFDFERLEQRYFEPDGTHWRTISCEAVDERTGRPVAPSVADLREALGDTSAPVDVMTCVGPQGALQVVLREASLQVGDGPPIPFPTKTDTTELEQVEPRVFHLFSKEALSMMIFDFNKRYAEIRMVLGAQNVLRCR